jgi:hypothetical protein
MTPDDPAAEVAKDYRAFARQEARGRSPAYESLAESAVGDAGLMSFAASLPYAKRQPNLLFAAARYFSATVRDLGVVWLSNEAPGVVPGLPETTRERGLSVLARDGHTPLAHTDPHGTWLRWLG